MNGRRGEKKAERAGRENKSEAATSKNTWFYRIITSRVRFSRGVQPGLPTRS